MRHFQSHRTMVVLQHGLVVVGESLRNQSNGDIGRLTEFRTRVDLEGVVGGRVVGIVNRRRNHQPEYCK